MLAPTPAPRPQAPPAKAWRNYYRFYRVLHLIPQGAQFPGVHPGPRAFASREIAERHARTFLARINPPGRCIVEHAGAFPEGERAN